jgi:hypothetical protein
MNKKDKHIWRFVISKVKGGFGETDFDKKIVKIDKAKHKDKKYKHSVPKQDNTLLNTIVHESLHTKKPKATEVQVRKQARLKINKMSRNAKAKTYNKIK